MRRNTLLSISALLLSTQLSFVTAQAKQTENLHPIVQNFVNEVQNNSQLESMAHDFLDGIGPRLIGTPELLAANNWTAEKMKS